MKRRRKDWEGKVSVCGTFSECFGQVGREPPVAAEIIPTLGRKGT